MILIALAALCVLSVPLTGGHLQRLAEIKLRCLWSAPLALALQVLIVTIAPDGHRSIHVAIHLGTYALAGLFLWANRRVAGMCVIATGALLNTLAIVINGGVMPASATAQRLAGMIVPRGQFENSTHLAHPHLLWLGDVIPVPGPLPNVLSIGDCIIFVGMLVLLHRTCSDGIRSRAVSVRRRHRWLARRPLSVVATEQASTVTGDLINDGFKPGTGQ
jgi:hypothetical protein